MRISELSARTDVPVGTLKYYLREGLLAPGRRTSRTGAEYDDSHVARVRLVRALTDAGGLGIAAVRRVVEVIDAPEPARLDVLATAQDALLREDVPDARPVAAGSGDAIAAPVTVGQDGPAPTGHGAPRAAAEDWVRERGWTAFPGDLVIARLERAWQACDQAGVSLDAELLDEYADAMEQVARLDVASVPQEPEGAVRRVVVGTVMLEPVLLALRLLAQRELSLRQAGGEADGCAAPPRL
ncbi:MerR family transcriptional regulator [Brachybacterium sp. AOP43-C2-M15]|uniref:MerR family transcriptional regulator n=1 Tax=Brachybacterium sp. AOP43-C2-M15 TaxID=3457661 RepID=UPI0040331A5C